ncbi:hypothetical protein CH378_09070 [Leptospira kmetyi]|uniref:SMI1/KNR4 family protein n=1 Tax=Leptospira kmetyi TaxID=408139 RepID=A0ABX4NCC3_9LEPT|nr:hypothetical protein CH378_09070 [Leptospira kmetyi]
MDRHEKVFGQKVPQRLLEFWKDGEFEKFENGYTRFIKTPLGPDGSFQLSSAVPSWEAMSDHCLDDAVVGPRGEWTNAKKFIPLFHADQSFFFVVKIDTPECSVGWFEEGALVGNKEDKNGYHSGVYLLTRTLDNFLATIGDSPDGDEVIECDSLDWEESLYLLEEEDDDEDEDDEDDSDGEDKEDSKSKSGGYRRLENFDFLDDDSEEE